MSSSVDILERVRRLVELSASSNEHEARNAAAKACALMREHKLRVELPVSARPARPHVTADDLADYFRRPTQDRAWERERAAAEARARGSQEEEARRARARFRMFGRARVMSSDLSEASTPCRKCGAEIAAGEWFRDVVGDPAHLVHDRCLAPDDEVEG